jgi:hypothetical protein
MMTDRRVPRWTEPGSDATPSLAELVKHERDDAPSDAMLRELAAKVVTAWESGPREVSDVPRVHAEMDTGARATGARQDAGGVGRSGLWIGLGVVVLTATAFWLWRGPFAVTAPVERRSELEAKPARAELPVVATPVVAARVVAAPAVAAPAVATPAVATPAVETPRAATPAAAKRAGPAELERVAGPVEDKTDVVVTRGRAARVSNEKAGATAGVAPRIQNGGTTDDEIEMLRDARAVLGNEPARALRIAGKHLREHPYGIFIEEREAIAIEALIRLGDVTLARSRARRFADRFPHSAYHRRLNGLLADR